VPKDTVRERYPMGRLGDRRYGFMAAVYNESMTIAMSSPPVRQGMAVLNVS
jgi:hypothetical protein